MEQRHVLEPCPIPTSVCVNVLKEHIQQYMLPRQEFYKDTKRSLYLEDEFSEWFLVKSTNGCQIGKGNEATDIITSQKEGIDAMCVVMNDSQSNEKSLIQNFNNAGCELDVLFNNLDHTTAVKLFMDELKRKLTLVCCKHDLADLYILAYVSLPTSVYITCFKYKIDLLDNVISSGFSQQGQSIMVEGFIDNKWGNVKLYKAKKRVELRIKKACIIDNPFSVKIYELPPTIEPNVEL